MSEPSKGIVSVALEDRLFEPPKKGFENAWVKSMGEYRAMYRRSIEDPESFWGEVAEGFFWYKKWERCARTISRRTRSWFASLKGARRT